MARRHVTLLLAPFQQCIFSTLTWKSVVNIWLASEVGSSKLSKSSPNSTGEAFIAFITSSAHIFLDSNILCIISVPLCIGAVILLFRLQCLRFFLNLYFSVRQPSPFLLYRFRAFLSFAKRTVCVWLRARNKRGERAPHEPSRTIFDQSNMKRCVRYV